MAGKSGGHAEKLGNRYERWWVARQLLSVLRGDFVSVTLEALGDDEAGVDLWVEEQDGTRHAQQCKRSNRLAGKWTIAELHGRGVLPRLRQQLERSPTHRFTFVSHDPAPELGSLCERARAAGDDAEAYWLHQIQPSANHRRPFQQFCAYLGFNPNELIDRSRAFDLLRRTTIHPFPDDDAGLRDLTLIANLLVDGNRDAVVRSLASLAEGNLAKPLHVDDVLTHLTKEGLKPRDLSLDANVAARIKQLNAEFRQSLKPFLIGNRLIPRSETQRILETVDGEANLIVLHGRAGYGKSTVLLELLNSLRSENSPYLALRFDRRAPANSASHYGREVCDLPESPVVCLKALAGDRPALLILDQLDAIRWTSGHATAGWECCLELIQQALRTPNMRVLIACRTFDLKHDPQISAWHRDTKTTEIEVGELPESEVEHVVNELGSGFRSLTPAQKKLLALPHALALWARIPAERRATSAFGTVTDLMREFWASLREMLAREGVPIAEYEEALQALVEMMDRKGRLYAPETVLNRFVAAKRSFQSLNIVSVIDRRVSFAHQSYFDYLLAERLSAGIARGNQTVLEWLRGNEQSLFRREQLRTLMSLLRDDEPDEYLKTLKMLLTDPDIRFHLKHLALQSLSQRDPPSDAESELVLRLLVDDNWRDHILRYVIRGQPAWFDALSKAGVIQAWLESRQDDEIIRAIELLSLVSDRRGDGVSALLEPYLAQPEPWPRRVADALPRDTLCDTDSTFRIRTTLISSGVATEHLLVCHWEKLAKEQPSRALQLLEALLKWVAVEIEENRRSPHARPTARTFHQTADWVEQQVAQAAEEKPSETLDWLLPLVQHIEVLYRDSLDDSTTICDDMFWAVRDSGSARGLGTVVLGTLVAALRSLAESNSEEFARQFEQLSTSTHDVSQDLLMRVLERAPLSLSDRALTWLCARSGQFAHGSRFELFPLARSCRIIERFAPHCSDRTLAVLTQAVLAFHREQEWDSMRHRASVDRPNAFGRPQLALLTALPRPPLSDRARDQLGMLERKFGAHYPALDQTRITQFRAVRSPLKPHVLPRLSDKTWLRIIRAEVPAREGPWREAKNGGHYESSHEYFAEDFGKQAKRQPQRFARLALSIPRSAYPGYLSPVLDALRLTNPPEPAQAQQAEPWAPAPAEDIEALLAHVGYADDDGQAMSFCRLIEDRSDCNWSDATIERLARYAIQHADPKLGEYASHTYVDREDRQHETVPDVANSSLNCVRAVAARVIMRLLFDHPRIYDRIDRAVRSLVHDPHVVVRVAAIGICLPVWNINRNKALELFLQACDTQDDRILTSHYIDQFLAHGCWRHLDQLRPVLDRMRRSHIDDVAKQGTARTTGVYVESGNLHDAVEESLTGSVPQRLGVAHVAAHWLQHREVRSSCTALLVRLFGDDSLDVRKAAAEFLRLDDVISVVRGTDTLARFVDSPAFLDDPFEFFRALQEHKQSILPYADTLLTACRRFADLFFAARSEDIGPHFHWRMDAVPPLLLRLYEQAEQQGNRDVQKASLDAWDRLLEVGVAVTYELLSETHQ